MLISYLIYTSSLLSSFVVYAGIQAEGQCKILINEFVQKGFNDNSLPKLTVSGDSLAICPSDYTCCTHEMEQALHEHSLMEFEKKVVNKIQPLNDLIKNQYHTFNDFFKQLIDDAKDSLNELFAITYGDLYKNNSEIFMNLFDEMKTYYEDGSMTSETDETVFDAFFMKMFQRVFELSNPTYEFDQDYISCVGQERNSMELPKNLANRVQRALVSAKSFVDALRLGDEITAKLSKFDPTEECSRTLTRMSYCQTCHDMSHVRPCQHHCQNVMSGCLKDISAVNQVWQQYLSIVEEMLTRLQSPFNIESVLEPFDVRVSEVAMLLQERKDAIRMEVFQRCGEPQQKTFVAVEDDISEDIDDSDDQDDLSSSMDMFDDVTMEDQEQSRVRRSSDEEGGNKKKKEEE